MIKNLIAGCSLLFVMCCSSPENPIEQCKIQNRYTSWENYSGRSVDIKEITINGQKYILAIGYQTVAICPSKN